MVVPDLSYLDTGDNAWQLTAASLVGLQSVPGLAVLYAGVVGISVPLVRIDLNSVL